MVALFTSLWLKHVSSIQCDEANQAYYDPSEDDGVCIRGCKAGMNVCARY